MIIFKGASVSLGLRLAGVVLAFFLNVLMAQKLSSDEFGIFVIVFQICGMSSVVFALGMSQVAIQKLPAIIHQSDRQSLSEFVNSGLIVILSTTSFFILLFFITGAKFSAVNDLEFLVVLACFSLATLRFLQEVARANRHMWSAQLGEQILLPVILILVSFWAADIKIILAGYVFFGFIISYFLFLRYAVTSAQKIPETIVLNRLRYLIRNIRVSVADGIPLGVSTMCVNLIMRGDVLVLGMTVSMAEVGLYGVAVKVVALLAFGLNAISAISAPIFSQLWCSRQLEQLQRRIYQSTILGIFFSLPVFLLLFFAPELLLGLFGEEFLEAALLVKVLAVGQCVNVITGPVIALLIATELGRLYFKVSVFLSGLSLIWITILSLNFGSVGAAVALVSIFVLMNILLVWSVYRHTGLISLPPLKLSHYLDVLKK